MFRFLMLVCDERIMLSNGSSSFVDATQVNVIAEDVDQAQDAAKKLLPGRKWYQVVSIVEEKV